MNNAACVLIVDDEPGIRLTFRTTLESLGYRTLEAVDGAEALARLEETEPDVVLLDLKMPGMDGMETLRRIRESGRDTAVVIVTAHGSVADAVAAMKLGAVDFLSKPMTPDALRRVVAEVITRHGKPAPGPEPRAAARSQAGIAPQPAPLEYGSVAALVAPAVVDLGEVKRALNLRDLRLARRLLEEVFDRFPDSVEALNLSGVLHEAQGDRHAAYWSYRRALEISPQYRPALENLKRYCEQNGLDFASRSINPSTR